MLLAQEVAARLEQRPLGNEPHDLGAGDADATGIGLAAHLVEGHMQRRDRDVGDVHRDLGDAVLLDVPADGLRGFERSGAHHRVAFGVLDDLSGDRVALADRPALLAHVEGNGVGTPRGGAVKVEIDGDQEVARTDRRSARAGHPFIEGPRPEVGSRVGVCEFLGQRLVLPGPADGQVAPLGTQGRGLVAVGRDAQLVGDAAGQRTRQLGALLERDARDRDQREDIRGSHARVGTLVVAHVDQFGGAPDSGEGRLDDRFG